MNTMDITFELEHIREALDNIEGYNNDNESILDEIRGSIEGLQDTFDEISNKKKEDMSKEELIDILGEIEYEIGNLYDTIC